MAQNVSEISTMKNKDLLFESGQLLSKSTSYNS